MKNCPYCKTPSPDGAKFCLNCGGNLVDKPAQETPPPDPPCYGAPAAAPEAPPPAAFTPAPSPAAAFTPAAPAPGAAPVPAPAAYPQAGYDYPPPGMQQPFPAKKSSTGCIIGIVIAAALGLGLIMILIFAVGMGGAFFFATKAVPSSKNTAVSSSKGFATPQEAVKDQIDPAWVTKAESESSDEARILAGPQGSEYVTAYTVVKESDGLWRVKEVKYYEP